MQYVTRRRATYVYSPVLNILSEIEQTGCLDSIGGEPVLHWKGRWYSIAREIELAVDSIEIACARHAWALSTRPLEVIGLRLAAGVPLSPDDIRKARECIRTAINLSMTLTRSEAADILRTVQTRHLLEAAA